MKFRYRLLVASLSALAISAGLFVWISRRVSGRGANTVPYTLLSQVKDYCDDGTVTDGHKELKFVDSKGNWRRTKSAIGNRKCATLFGHQPPATNTGSPNTSIRGVIPNPGAVEAASLPFFLCGAPSAVLTVT